MPLCPFCLLQSVDKPFVGDICQATRDLEIDPAVLNQASCQSVLLGGICKPSIRLKLTLSLDAASLRSMHYPTRHGCQELTVTQGPGPLCR